MVYFDNCDVAVNGSGVMATSANIQSQNYLDPAYILEMRGEMSKPAADSIRNVLNIDYYVEVDNEPNIEIINSIKAFRQDDHVAKPFPVEVAGITGNFYLQSYSFAVEPNKVTHARASFICYDQLTGNGDLSTKKKGDEGIDYNKSNSLAHGWTTYVASSGTHIEVPTYKMDYGFNAEYKPIYTIGRKFPKQVQMIKANEEIKFMRDKYKHIVFSGEKAEEALPNFENDSEADLFEIEALCGSEESQTNQLKILVSGAVVTSTAVIAGVGKQVRTAVSVNRNY